MGTGVLLDICGEGVVTEVCKNCAWIEARPLNSLQIIPVPWPASQSSCLWVSGSVSDPHCLSELGPLLSLMATLRPRLQLGTRHHVLPQISCRKHANYNQACSRQVRIKARCCSESPIIIPSLHQFPMDSFLLKRIIINIPEADPDGGHVLFWAVLVIG